MKFGIFCEISVPRPWTAEAEKKVYDNCLEQVKLADELGFDYVWAVEHHFLEEYSHCSAPEVFLTACAMVTKRIRIGHGIVVCLPPINNPARIAERTATMDIVSGGRLDVGTGRSGTWVEMGAFGVNPDDTKKMWDEVVHCLPRMWTQETFSYEGRYWSLPPRAVIPKPYQKPHPPMWVAVTSPGTEVDAGERGLGCLGLTFGSVSQQEERGKTYRKLIRNCEPVGAVINEHISALNFLYCHQDNEEGVRTGQRFAGTFGYLAAMLLSTHDVYPTTAYKTGGLLPGLRADPHKRGAGAPKPQPKSEAPRVPESITIGDPDRVEKALRRWESAGVDTVNFLLNAAETIPQEEMLASMRLFAREVMPRFKPGPVVRPSTAEVAAVAGAR
ncbi:MAG TPA: LLM class flavin-dependent oxidoreductase [Candidatus Binataceae bacterium]|nr:LLM class flavin-dependent oxidoreductase [Candidatus Binataceae bacterium]